MQVIANEERQALLMTVRRNHDTMASPTGRLSGKRCLVTAAAQGKLVHISFVRYYNLKYVMQYNKCLFESVQMVATRTKCVVLYLW